MKLLQQKAFLQRENQIDTLELNKAQRDFYTHPARSRMFLGGNGSGKSYAILYELAMTHLRMHKHRDVSSILKTWWFCPDLKKVEDYIDELKKIVPPSKFPEIDKMGTPNPRRLNWQDGSSTTFFSYEQDSKAAESTNIDAVFFDEPPPRSLYIAAYRGLRSNPNHFLCFAMTPLDEPWIYEELYLPAVRGETKEIAAIFGSTYGNKVNLSEAWLDEFSSALNEEEKKVRLEGEFAVLQGRVFKEFSRQTHVMKFRPWPKDWPVWLCIDPHTRKESVAIWIGVTKDEELVVINEAEASSIEALGHKINRVEREHRYRIVCRLIDNSGLSADWGGTSTAIDILRVNCDLRVRAVEPREKDVDEGIFQIKRLLRPETLTDGHKLPRLLFLENCRNTITEMELYGWKENRHPERTGTAEKVKKVYDDHIDPIRYIVMTHPKFHVQMEPLYLGGISPDGHRPVGYTKSRPSERYLEAQEQLKDRKPHFHHG